VRCPVATWQAEGLRCGGTGAERHLTEGTDPANLIEKYPSIRTRDSLLACFGRTGRST